VDSDAQPRRGAELDGVPWDDMTPEEQENERRLAIAYHEIRLNRMLATMVRAHDVLRRITIA
jgi:hypothetical protein